MADTPPEERPDRSDETAKLELPSLSLPRFGRRRKRAEATAEPAPEPAREPTPAQDPQPWLAPDREPTPRPAPAAARHVAAAPSVVVDDTQRTEPDREVADQPSEHVKTPHREPFSLPSLPPRLAVALTGLLVGVVGVGLTYGGLQGCNAVRGTETCGGGAGLLLLVVILVVLVLLGAALLRLLGLTEAGGTSFLAIGVVVVVSLLALQGILQSAAMAVVLPVLCVAAYLLAHWVTTAFVEPRPEKGPEHDVR